MPDPTFLTSCNEQLAVNAAPITHRLTQALHIKLKPGSSLAFVAPDVEALADAFNELAGRPAGDSQPARSGSLSLGGLGMAMAAGEMMLAKDKMVAIKPDLLQTLTLLIIPPLCLFVTYEQTWTSLGYTRGQLINSFALAPGEQLTVEVLSWDRLKSERSQDFETASDTQQTASITGRISLETITDMRFKMAMGAEGGVNGEVSLKDMDIPADVGADGKVKMDAEFEGAIKTTRQQVLEATRTVSAAIRANRKTRISETREVGSESRTTRRITNENRCHTLTFDYFEVLESYRVTTRPVDARLCVMLPIDPPAAIDLDWVLTHEHVLRRELPDLVYESGFEAARLLKAANVFQERIQPAAAPLPTAPTTAGGAPAVPSLGTPQAQAVRTKLEPYVRNLVQIAADLAGGTDDELGRCARRATDLNFNDTPTGDEWADAKVAAGKKHYRLWLAGVWPSFYGDIGKLQAGLDNPQTTLEPELDIFLRAGMWVAVSGSLLQGPSIYGIPVPLNDAGLAPALSAASGAMQSIRDQSPLPAAAVGAETTPTHGDSQPAPPGEKPPSLEQRLDEAFGIRELAVAQVEFERLAGHIRENAARYLSAIFSDRGPDAWRQLLERYPHVAQVVDGVLLGVVRGKGIFPLRKPFQDQLLAVNAELGALMTGAPDPADSVDITVPTPGQVLEGRLGQCDTCEPFLADHRRLDVELRTHEVALAKGRAEQQAEETERRRARRTAVPPLLDDPAAPPAPLSVRLETVDGG